MDDDAGYVHAINPTNGSKKWSYRVSNYAVQSGPAVGSDGKICVCSDRLYVFESNGNYTIYPYPVAGDYVEQSSPAIGNKILYVGSWDGYLYVISVSSSGLANTSWPKFRQNNRNTGK